MTGGDILIECLKAQGVRCVFGMPGTQNIQIYDSLLRRGAGAIDHYLVRHEYASTQMADGYARSTGEVGVALTVPGPGCKQRIDRDFGGIHRLRACVADYWTERLRILRTRSEQDVSRLGSDEFL